MYTNLALILTAFFLCFVLTPLCRMAAIRVGLLDQPDEKRKLHKVPVPRVGGAAIMLSYAAALFLVIKLTPTSGQIHIQHRELLRVMLPAALLVFLVGFVDDLFNIKPWQKLGGQVAAAALAIGLGAHYAPGMLTLGVGSMPFWLNASLTLIWLIACMNAMNLIDGLDGLAAGVGLLATVSTLLVGLFTGNSGLVLATMPLVGALLAFLCYNFAPASIYLGDCGSLTIGFMLGAFSLVWSHHGHNVFSIAAPLMVLALPLLDSALAIGRRYLRNTPIFGGDRGHIHHMIMARGFKTRHATLILYAVCAVAASLALLQSLGSRFLRGAILVVFVLLVIAGLQYLRYVEFSAALRALFRQNLVRSMREEIYLEDLERTFSTFRTMDETWSALIRICEGLHFSSIELYLQEEHLQYCSSEEKLECDWSLTIPLGERGYLRLQRPNVIKPPTVAMAVIDVLQQCLSRREALRPSINHREAA